MSRRVVVVLWVASVAAAVWIARPSEQRAAAPPAPVREVGREARVVAPPVDHLSAEDVRRAVREEIAAGTAHAPLAVDETIAEETRERIAEARTIVRGAIDAGRWTDASRDELRQRMSSLPRAELDQVLGELFGALNTGRVRADVHGPLM